MKTKKRILSVILTLAMLLTMMMSMTITSHAKSDVNVTTAAQLKSYLQASEYNCTVLQKDISLVDDFDSKYWCTINGYKWIDLNGHTLDISNNNKRGYSTMFNVPSETRLIVYDSTNSGKGNIHFDGRINDDGSFRDRSIFEVTGELDLNGVTIEAGRSKSFYSAKYATTVWKQIFGTAVIARSGSKVYINSSTLYGRGDNVISLTGPDYGRNCAIEALNGSRVYFNDGTIRAKGGANCFNIFGGATVKVMNGTFTCDKLDAIKCDGSITKGIGKGRVGINNANLGMFAVASGDVLDGSSAKVTPGGNSTGYFTAKSGDTVTENGKTVHRLLTSDPKATFECNGDGYGASNYFVDVNIGTTGAEYHKYYTMKIYKNGTLVGTDGPHAQGQTTFSMYNDVVNGFNPEKGVVYNLVCEFEEILNGVHAAGRTEDFFFKIVDDIQAPVISSQSSTDIYYSNGEQITLQVTASGTNLDYVWQRKKPGEFAWTQLMSEKNSTLNTGTLTEADDGTIYRSAVSNSKGITWAQDMTLHCKTKKISQIDLSINAPVHGVPLDFTAETSTAGCKVVDVQWEVLMGDKAGPGYVPFAGQTMVADIIVEENGATFADNATATIGTKKNSTKSFPASNQLRFSFTFTVDPPASGDVAIDTAWMQMDEPKAGSKPGYLSIVEDGPYKGTYARDVRFGDGVTEWYCNGQKISMSDPLEAGKEYTVQTTLTASKGWFFNESSTAELNGEPMIASLQGGKLVVSSQFVMDETSDPAASPSGKINPFEDVYESDPYYDAVLWAYYASPQITNGMDETHFGPLLTVTRGQCVTFLWRSQGCPEPTTTVNPFEDVSSDEYYYKPILWAVENGITKGVDTTHFNPMDTLSTQHIVTFLYRTEFPGKDGWDGDAAVWASDEYGKPFGVDIAVNNSTDCPRADVVLFLYRCNG